MSFLFRLKNKEQREQAAFLNQESRESSGETIQDQKILDRGGEPGLACHSATTSMPQRIGGRFEPAGHKGSGTFYSILAPLGLGLFS
jgi:hypothetical protein